MSFGDQNDCQYVQDDYSQDEQADIYLKMMAKGMNTLGQSLGQID